MIDWVTFTAPYQGEPINDGMVVNLSREGEIKFTVDRRLPVAGSHDSKAYIRAYGDAVQISVNPSKYLQGHNLFGSNDLHALVLQSTTQIFSRLGSQPLFTIAAIRLGNYKLSRLDITESFSLGTRTDCLNWLAAAKIHLVQGRQKTNRHQYEGTIYIGQESQRLCVKIYYKGDEFRKRPSNHDTDLVNALKNWSNDKIRIEVTLRGKQLNEHVFCHGFTKINKRSFQCKKLTLEKPKAWSPELCEKIYWHVVKDKVRLPKDSSIARFDMNNLKRAVRSTYFMWQNGMKPEDHLPKATFYRHRAILLEQIAVDIKTEPHQISTRNVIPLIRIIEAKPAGVPDWAHQYGLVVNS